MWLNDWSVEPVGGAGLGAQLGGGGGFEDFTDEGGAWPRFLATREPPPYPPSKCVTQLGALGRWAPSGGACDKKGMRCPLLVRLAGP